MCESLMKLLRTTALTAALMTAAVPSLTTPADAWGWGWRGGWGWGGVPYYGYIGYPAYYGYGFAYPAYGYGSGYYGGYTQLNTQMKITIRRGNRKRAAAGSGLTRTH